TSGLDPNQLEEIRSLIKNLGREKTVMLSTHIMQEVEAICSRVIIIDKGRIVADDRADQLRSSGLSLEAVLVEFDAEVAPNDLLGIAGVQQVTKQGDRSWVLGFPGANDIRAAVFEFAVKRGVKVLTMQKAERGLEEVFKELTKR
ncbi:MAG: gliding motility-associated ABC transporter ATP-binding subunit GldA, partial [Flavobacteriales bacterium]|nr:gliding motility-associated ABC transporter ATP-binding subunit GldA [Flavobacteriales bacterium]